MIKYNIINSKKTPSIFEEIEITLTLMQSEDKKTSLLKRGYFNTISKLSMEEYCIIDGPVSIVEEDIYYYCDKTGFGFINFKTGSKIDLEKRIREKFASKNLEVVSVSLEKELKVPNLEYFLKIKVKGLEEFKICIDFNSKESNFRCLTTFGIESLKVEF